MIRQGVHALAADDRCARCDWPWPCPSVQDRPGTIKCPGCELRLLADYLRGQMLHMTACHPELIETRREEAARWDGWVND